MGLKSSDRFDTCSDLPPDHTRTALVVWDTSDNELQLCVYSAGEFEENVWEPEDASEILANEARKAAPCDCDTCEEGGDS